MSPVNCSKLVLFSKPFHYLEHCIERLREYLMCRPDMTIFTYDWIEGRDDEPMPNHAVQHECVNWDSLKSWINDRKFSIADGLIERADGRKWPDNFER
jgi:hypothetical protein